MFFLISSPLRWPMSAAVIPNGGQQMWKEMTTSWSLLEPLILSDIMMYHIVLLCFLNAFSPDVDRYRCSFMDRSISRMVPKWSSQIQSQKVMDGFNLLSGFHVWIQLSENMYRKTLHYITVKRKQGSGYQSNAYQEQTPAELRIHHHVTIGRSSIGSTKRYMVY